MCPASGVYPLLSNIVKYHWSSNEANGTPHDVVPQWYLKEHT